MKTGKVSTLDQLFIPYSRLPSNHCKFSLIQNSYSIFDPILVVIVAAMSVPKVGVISPKTLQSTVYRGQQLSKHKTATLHSQGQGVNLPWIIIGQ